MQGGGREGPGTWGGRGCSGPRATEPAARSGDSGNGPLPSSRLSRLETQLSCTQGQRGRTPRPALESLPTEPSPQFRLVWAASESRGGVGGATLSSLHRFILTQSDSGSKLPSFGKLTLSLGRGFRNASWAASGPSCLREGPLSTCVCCPTRGREHIRGGAGGTQSEPCNPGNPPQVVVARVKGAWRSASGAGSCLAGDLAPCREESGG